LATAAAAAAAVVEEEEEEEEERDSVWRVGRRGGAQGLDIAQR
jgi:hypothetical protein